MPSAVHSPRPCAGFLYYRTDQVDAVPKTWQEVYEKAAQSDGIAYQGAPARA
jgi:maltose-binding protein MalE